MNGKDVMDALANIDDDLILDAKSQPRAVPRWLKYGSMAVCICCAVLLTLLCVEKLRSGGEDTGKALAPGSEQTEPAFPEASSAEEETAIPEESSADEEAAVPEETELEISLDSQGNLSCIQWGTPMTKAQALFPDAKYSRNTLSLTGTCFDFPVTLSLQFSQVYWSDAPILYGAALIFSEEADLDRLSEELDQLFGPVETQGETMYGETYDLQEADYYWHSPRHLKELADADAVQAYISAQEEVSDTSSLDYILRTMYPVTITLAREDYTLNLDAKYAVELEQINAAATDNETAPTTSQDLEEDVPWTTITDDIFGLSMEVPEALLEDLSWNTAEDVVFEFQDQRTAELLGNDQLGFVWEIEALTTADFCETFGYVDTSWIPGSFGAELYMLGKDEDYVYLLYTSSGMQHDNTNAENAASYVEAYKYGYTMLQSFLTNNGITGNPYWEAYYEDKISNIRYNS
jgi:hypothetical protein